MVLEVLFFLISKLINIIFNRYIVLLDTYELIFNSNKSNYSYGILMKRKSLRNFIGEDTFKNIENSKLKNLKSHIILVKMKSHLILLKEKMNYIKKKIVKIH